MRIVQDPAKYWFPAKTYGWGWGAPRTWEGWTVLALYVAAIAALTHFFPPRVMPGGFGLGLCVATAILIAVCWLKGEPPRWRWGDRQ
ncbi:hypothetical protein [Dyella sp.]|uniref:hypothetical protein n=1 Tax=Dyella sp. TaxID=1869338 RepID=UPI0039C8607A